METLTFEQKSERLNSIFDELIQLFNVIHSLEVERDALMQSLDKTVEKQFKMETVNNLQKFKDDLSRGCYKMTKNEGIEKGICINCREPAIPKCYSEAGRKEYYISGLCEICFDKLFS